MSLSSRKSLAVLFLAGVAAACDTRLLTESLLATVPSALIPPSTSVANLRCWYPENDGVPVGLAPLTLRLTFIASSRTVSVSADQLWATRDRLEDDRAFVFCSSYRDEPALFPTLGRTGWAPFFFTQVVFEEDTFVVDAINYNTPIVGHPELGAQPTPWTDGTQPYSMPPNHGR